MQRPASKTRAAPGVVRVAQTRADILGMITRLKREERGPARRGDPARSTARRGSAAETSSSHARPPVAEPALQAGLMLALQRLEARLTKIETALSHGGKAAEGSTAHAAAFSAATFSGLIQGQMLSDMLQLVSSNGMSGIFVIENDDTSCTLTFDSGRMCHAASKEATGEEAFFAAFALPSGKYHFKEMAELPPERTISAGTQFLVLEALRRMDEKNG